MIGLAGGDGLADVRFGGPGENGDAAGGLLADDAVDAAAFLRREAGELARGAVWVQAVDALGDEPVDVAAESGSLIWPSASRGTMWGV